MGCDGRVAICINCYNYAPATGGIRFLTPFCKASQRPKATGRMLLGFDDAAHVPHHLL